MSDTAANSKGESSDSDRKRLEILHAQMSKLRGDLEAYRKTTHLSDEDYLKLRNDLEYQLMLRSGGFVQKDDGFIVKRIYPSLEEIFYERPPVNIDERSIDWKMMDNKVYVKEFFDGEEPIKKQKVVVEEGEKRFGKKIKVEIPKEFKKDFENFIGENLALKIGVLSILFAIVLGYNLLISEGHISKGARIAVGAFVGTGFFGLSYFLYLKRVSIVAILVGAGIITLYYTVYVAIHDYHIFTPVQAFASAALITSFAVAFSLWYDKRELSVLAIFGGYLTPYLAKTGGGDYFSFLTYLTLLNIGMLTISYLKNWRNIQFISFISTVLFMSYWINEVDVNATQDIIGMLAFACVFHMMFFVMMVIFDIKEGIEFTRFDFYISLSNTVLLILGGIFLLYLLPATDRTIIGYFFLGIGAFKLIYIFLLFGKSNVDEDLLDLQIGGVILLVNIAIYLVLKRNVFVNTFYAIESVGLLWLGIRMKNDVVKAGSTAIMLFAITSMGYAWHLTYNVYPEVHPAQIIHPIFNGGFWAGAINFGAVVFTLKFLHEQYPEKNVAYLPKDLYMSVLSGVALLTFYLTFLFELIFHTQEIAGGNDLRVILLAIYNMAFAVLVRFIIEKANVEKLRDFNLGLGMLLVVLYMPVGYFSIVTLRDAYINGSLSISPFMWHYISLIISVALIYYILVDIVKHEGYLSSKYEYGVLLACVAFVAHATTEFEHLFVLFLANVGDADIEATVSQFRKTSFTVLWTVLSFTLMLLGMRWKIKEIRKISLFLFGLTIIKFFSFDFWKMEIVGRIISFLAIGALLILVSQLYRQQLKMLIEKGELGFDRDEKLSDDKAEALAKIRKQMEESGATEVEISDDIDEEQDPDHFNDITPDKKEEKD